MYIDLDKCIAIDVVRFRGCSNIKASHRTTFEITRDYYVTSRGDCIIGVSASKGVVDIDSDVKDVIRNDDSIILIAFLYRDRVLDVVTARGSSKLLLSDSRRIVVRKSSFIGPETLAINASKAASDLSRELVDTLRRGSEIEIMMVLMAIRASCVLKTMARFGL